MTLFNKYDVMLAPMAGITNLPFRLICEEAGCDLAFSEMVSAMGLIFSNQKTKRLIQTCDEEKILGVQLFGHDPKIIADEAKVVEQELGEKLSHIDINMGCPARKIIKKGDGASLMKDPRLAAKIVTDVKVSIDVPLTVKFRRGFENGNETCAKFARVLETAGADAVCVHGRYAMQYYKGFSDILSIKRVKESVSIPVIGNGDVFAWQDYVDMKNSTGCDAVLIARGASKSPLLFRQIKNCIEGKEVKEVSVEDIMNVAIKHVNKIEEVSLEGRAYNFSQFRKQAMNYCEGIPGARVARKRICEANEATEFISIFENLMEENRYELRSV